MGAGAAFALCFAASRTTCRDGWVRFAALRLLEFCRTVPVVVLALVFVVAFGVGPLPGVLALAIHTAGALGKLFAEVVESADAGPAEGVRAAGRNLLQAIRFGVLPQVLPVIAGQALYFFESNVRPATIIGIVGAGGIGLHLYEAVRTLEWREVSFLVLMVLVAVAAIDAASARLRAAMRTG